MADCCPDPFGTDTSGSTGFQLLAKDLITEAYALLQMATEGEDLTPEMLSEGFRSLNMMVATWQSQGIHLWSYEDAALFLENGKSAYDLDISRATNEYTQTVSEAELVAGQSDITLQNSTSITKGWSIGILLNDDQLFWTTATDVSGKTITLKDAIPVNVRTNAIVIYYEKQMAKAERVLDLRS